MAIEVLASCVRVADLVVLSRDVADYLRQFPEEEHETIFVQAVEIGVFCLERARTSQDTEFVKRQVQGLLNQVEQSVAEIPSKVENQLVSKIGMGDGQVLAPVLNIVNEVSKQTSTKLTEVSNLLSQEVDPTRETSTVCRVLKSLTDLLDCNRVDSIQGSFNAALTSATAEDGVLAKSVKVVVSEAVKPLAEQVDKLSKEVRADKAVAKALEGTTKKGASFEEEVIEQLEPWSRLAGAQIAYVGIDNRPGDVLVKLSQTSLAQTETSIVIETRDRQDPKGRKAITDDLGDAMAERGADAAIYLSRFPEGLAKEIGEWAEGALESGYWVATTPEHLTTAIRYLITQLRLSELRSQKPRISLADIEAYLQRIRTSLRRITNINTQVTGLRQSTGAIETEAAAIKREVGDALLSIEQAIRTLSGEEQSVGLETAETDHQFEVA